MDVTDVTRAGYLPLPSPTARAVPVSAGASLDQVVNSFTSRGEGLPGQTARNAERNTFQRPVERIQQQTSLEDLLASQTYSEGGPNWNTIRQLQAQRAAAQKNYKTNRADAQNLYGVLSTDATKPSGGLIGEIEQMGKMLQSGYTGAISASETRAEGQKTGLSEEQKRQQANRERAAAELGIAPESILTDYSSDAALNKAMGDVAASSGSWENLLRSQQGSALERTNALITATGNTRNQTILGMKAYLDAQQAQIDAQIAAEKAKTPTQKLTALGKLLESRMNEQIANELFPSQSLTPRQTSERNAMTDLGLDPNNPAHKARFRQLQASGSEKLKNAKLGAQPLTTEEQIAVDALGVPLSYFGPDYASYGAGR